MKNAPVQVDAAKQQLAATTDVALIAEMRHLAKAAAKYAKTGKDRFRAQTIEVEAFRRLGELIAADPEVLSRRGESRNLTDLYGLDRNRSSWAQTIAAKEADNPGWLEDTINQFIDADLEGHVTYKQLTEHAIWKKALGAHVGENTGDHEWYTPAHIIEAARTIMGSIDVDPATSTEAQKTVKAPTYYTLETNGLNHDWPGNVWLNPPYQQPHVTQFTQHLVEQYANNITTQACLLINNATETDFFQTVAGVASAIHFPRGRIKFTDQNGKPGAPLQGQAILYLGPRHKAFTETFTDGFVALI